MQQGGRKLDAFDTVLPVLYTNSGFTTTARMRWSDESAPPEWNKDTFKDFNGGEPDVVFMAYNPAFDSLPAWRGAGGRELHGG